MADPIEELSDYCQHNRGAYTRDMGLSIAAILSLAARVERLDSEALPKRVLMLENFQERIERSDGKPVKSTQPHPVHDEQPKPTDEEVVEAWYRQQIASPRHLALWGAVLAHCYATSLESKESAHARVEDAVKAILRAFAKEVRRP